MPLTGQVTPTTHPPYERGDGVWIHTHGENGAGLALQVGGVVLDVSRDGTTMVVLFDAIIGGWIGRMPIFKDDEDASGTAWVALDGMLVSLEPMGLKWALPPVIRPTR